MGDPRRLVLALVVGCSEAAPPPPPATPSAPPATAWRTTGELPGGRLLWDRGATHPHLIAGAFVVAGAAEAAARSFFAAHAQLFDLRADGSDLALENTRQGLAGTYLRFDEQVSGLPVFDGQVIALWSAGEIRAVNLRHHGGVIAPAPSRDIGGDRALAAARAAVGNPGEMVAPIVVRGVVAGPPSRLAYRVKVTADTPASWDVGVDATTGEILWHRDVMFHADGEGLVFDVNPVSTTNNTTLADNNDATDATLDAQRFSVVLPRLDGSGVLRGQYVDATRKAATQRANEPMLAFDYDRADDHFEEVMAYYHLDRVQDRIQQLGFTNVNNRTQVAVVDAITDDNSFYVDTSKEIHYGTGGVDDAEDGEVIVHEYGHACQDDQVPGFGGGDEGAMGEGFGDYLAGSMEAVLAPGAGHAQIADPMCLADWDAVSYSTDTPPCLRRLDGTKHYPEAADGEVHDDGEMWSAALWAARTGLDADTMDKLAIEAHFLLATTATFDEAANAILMADDTTSAGMHLPALRKALYHQGVLRTPMAPSSITAPVTPEAVDIRSPTVAMNQYAARLDDTQMYTRAGAMALRVHFATLDTEDDPACLDNGCDNVYLYDAAGDLYQILHGPTQADITSVAIPGDTVQIRLVTDATVQHSGYVIDRIDILGTVSPPDAGVDAAGADAAGNPDNGGEHGGGCCQTSGGGAGSVVLALLVLGLALKPRAGAASPNVAARS